MAGAVRTGPLATVAGLLVLAGMLVAITALPWLSRRIKALPPMPGLFPEVGPGQRWCARCGTAAPKRGTCPSCGHAAKTRALPWQRAKPKGPRQDDERA